MGAITVGDIIAILSLFIAAVGFSLSFWQYVKNKRRTRAEKAVELARNFADDILKDMSEVKGIWVDTHYVAKMDELLKKYDMHAVCFTMMEFKLLPLSLYAELLLACIDSIECLEANKISLGHVLNKIEAMAMTLVTGVADKDVVYKSLHKVYCGFLKYCSVYLCMQNTSNYASEQLYTYSIKLYKIWVEKTKRLDAKDDREFRKREKRLAKNDRKRARIEMKSEAKRRKNDHTPSV